MRKYIDKINSYIELNKGTKIIWYIKFFAPLFFLMFIKLIFFITYNVLHLENCIVLFIYIFLWLSIIFIIVLLIHLSRVLYRLFCQKKCNVLFRLLVFTSIGLCICFFISIPLWTKIFGLVGLLFMVAILILLVIFFITLCPIYVYINVKNKNFLSLFDSILDLKQSIVGLILCILFDNVTIFYPAILSNSGKYEAYLFSFSSYFYITFFILNLISCIKSKLTKQKI